MIQLYKPTAKCTGAAIAFQAADKDNRSLFVNMIKQASWDATKKKGSFLENKGKPGMTVSIKFNQIEAGSMLDAIERFYTFSAYHSSQNNATQIIFGPAEGDNPSCYVFKVIQTNLQDTNQKSSFFIPISFGEARLIKEYLIHFLHKSFKRVDNKPVQVAVQTPANPSPAPNDAGPEQEPFPTTTQGHAYSEYIPQEPEPQQQADW